MSLIHRSLIERPEDYSNILNEWLANCTEPSAEGLFPEPGSNSCADLIGCDSSWATGGESTVPLKKSMADVSPLSAWVNANLQAPAAIKVETRPTNVHTCNLL